MLRKAFHLGALVVALVLLAGLAGDVSAHPGPLPPLPPVPPGPYPPVPPGPYPPRPWYPPWYVIVPIPNDPIVPTWQNWSPPSLATPAVNTIPTMPARVLPGPAR